MFLPTHECAFIEKCMDTAHGPQHVPHEQAGIQTLLRELGHIHSLRLQPHSAQVKTWGFRFYWAEGKLEGTLTSCFCWDLSAVWFLDPHFLGLRYVVKPWPRRLGDPSFFSFLTVDFGLESLALWACFLSSPSPWKLEVGGLQHSCLWIKATVGSAMCIQFLGIAINIYPNNELWPPG